MSSFSVICDLISLSWILRQGVILVFACLFIYSLTRGPELFACLSIYENAETLSHSWMGTHLVGVIPRMLRDKPWSARTGGGGGGGLCFILLLPT